MQMSTFQKLNSAYFSGSLLLAGIAGAIADSWSVFAIALSGLVASNLYLREIRPGRSR
jgi:hypothetical protein